MHTAEEIVTTHQGRNIFTITLCNDLGTQVNILNYGAVIQNILIPDSDNVLHNQVLSYNTVEEYFDDPHYVGCVVGRYANRISGGILPILDKTWHLSVNEIKNNNHLHGGFQGFNKKLWEVKNTFTNAVETGVTLSTTSPHLEEGYPGNLTVDVTYILSNENELIIKYNAATDQTTAVNLTNHTYFNLSAGANDISSHLLLVNANDYTPADAHYIPGGRIMPVNNSVFDLRDERVVGALMHTIDTANFCLSTNGALQLAARLTDSQSNRTLEVKTTCPGLQLYFGNYLNGAFEPFSGICLEPQYYPDSPNRPLFPSTLLFPGEVYEEVTLYKFL